MIRNLKALGLALVAAFALSAVVASAASAQSQGTITVEGGGEATGVATEITLNRLTAFGGGVDCSGSTATVHKAGSTTALVPNGATEVTVRPHYSHTSCNLSPVSWPTTIDPNECEFRVKLGETTGGVNGTYGVTVDVECPAGKEITITSFTTAADRAAGITPACIQHVKPQTDLTGAHATDVGDGHIRVHGTIVNIHVHKTSTGHSPVLCATSTSGAATFDVDLTIEGTSGGTTGPGVVQRNLSLSHP